MNPEPILVAPASFKGTLSALRVAEVMSEFLTAHGLSSQLSPITDGGDDTLAILSRFDPGFQAVVATVNGPLPEATVEASYLVHMKNRLIVIEAAQAHGISRLPQQELIPMEATSYGVGELITLAQGVTAMAPEDQWTLLITLGGSASTDAGVGALQALGCRFYGEANDPIQFKLNASGLSHIHKIIPPPSFALSKDLGKDSGHKPLQILIATDVNNPLLGPNGCAPVFGPQKGASEADIEYLERELARLVRTFSRDFKRPQSESQPELLPGSGAGGGLGFGLSHLPNARLVAGAPLLNDFLGLQEQIDQSSVIITGEGSFDSQSLSGKATGYLIELAKGKPVFVFCGQKDDSLSSLALFGELPENVRVVPLVNEKFNINEALYEPEKALNYALSQTLPELKKAMALNGNNVL